MAAHHGKLESCQVLINRGANALLRDCHGLTAAQIAEQKEHPTVASYLIVVETCIRLANQVVTLRENLQISNERNEALRLGNEEMLCLDKIHSNGGGKQAKFLRFLGAGYKKNQNFLS